MVDQPPVVYSVTDGVADIELNRPDSFNALNLEMAQALTYAVERAAGDAEASVVLLTGRGSAFCAGGDVKMVAAAEDVSARVHQLATAAHDAVIGLRRLEKPVIAAVHGPIAGGGLGISCSADILLAGESTRLVPGYAGIAVTPDCGLTWTLPRMIGERRALEFLLLNHPLHARVAKEWGLVNEVHADHDVMEAGRDLAQSLASSPAALSLGKMRKLVRDAAERTLSSQLRIEATSIAEMVATPESRSLVELFARP